MLKQLETQEITLSTPTEYPGEFLRQIGIFGFIQIEDIILAGLVTQDPILLVGGHGSAKTLLAKRIAQALGNNFYAYDASKAMFEDVIGFPNPHSLSEGIIEYTPTPISIWDKEFILIDELSRASPSMQNKWLEVIRSRSIMGKSIKSLKYIIAAMNPPGYLGSMPLDAALAGRFTFIITIPEARDMDASTLQNIINHISEDDAWGIQNNRFHLDKTVGEELKIFLDRIRDRFPEISAQYNPHCLAYITNVMTTFKLQHRPLDGRRLGMLRRNIIAYLGVKMEKTHNTAVGIDELDQYLFECLKFSLPYWVTGESLPENLVHYAHQMAIKLMGKNSPRLQARLNVFLARTPIEMVNNFNIYHKDLTMADYEDLISHIEEEMTNTKSESGFISAFFALREIIRMFQQNSGQIDPDVARRAMAIYYRLTTLTDGSKIKKVVSFFEEDKKVNAINIRRIDLQDPNDILALRLALNMSDRNSDEREAIIRRYELIKVALKGGIYAYPVL